MEICPAGGAAVRGRTVRAIRVRSTTDEECAPRRLWLSVGWNFANGRFLKAAYRRHSEGVRRSPRKYIQASEIFCYERVLTFNDFVDRCSAFF